MKKTKKIITSALTDDGYHKSDRCSSAAAAPCPVSQSVSRPHMIFFEAPKGVSPSPSPPPLQLCRPAGPSLTPAAAAATIARNESPLSTRGRRKERERMKKAAKRRFMALKGVCRAAPDGRTHLQGEWVIDNSPLINRTSLSVSPLFCVHSCPLIPQLSFSSLPAALGAAPVHCERAQT